MSSAAQSEWRIAPDRTLPLEPFVLMGVLNITPDSFSDGGTYTDPNEAVARGLEMVEEGAAIIDIGGESTRPGSRRMPANTQLARVLPVIRRLRARTDALISIDTTLSEVAAAALAAGADVINDVSACTEDVNMATLAAERGCGLIIMHRLRSPEDDSYSDQYNEEPNYDDVCVAVTAFLRERIAFVTDRGVQHQSIVVDPGLGFGKTVAQNCELIARSGEVGVIDGRAYPVLGAASRKSFIGAVSGASEPPGRVAGTLAASVAQHRAAVRIFRVHDVAAHAQALHVAHAIAANHASG